MIFYADLVVWASLGLLDKLLLSARIQGLLIWFAVSVVGSMAGEDVDWRNARMRSLIAQAGYCDQPYVDPVD